MSEKTSADNLLERIDQKTESVDPDAEEQEEQDPTEEEEEVETTDSDSEEEAEEQEELPENVKEILRKNRKELRTVKADLADAKKKLEAKETPDGGEDSTPKAEDSRYKNLFINTAAKAALVEAGFTTGTDRFARMIDTSTLTVEDDGTITGLDEQVEEIKEDFADVLAKPANKKTVKADAARRTDTPAKPKSSADTLANLMTGGK